MFGRAEPGGGSSAFSSLNDCCFTAVFIYTPLPSRQVLTSNRWPQAAQKEPHNQDLIPYYQTYLLRGYFQPAVWKLVFLSGYIIYNQWGQTWIILGFHASTAVLVGLLPPGSFSLLSCLHFILFCFYRGEYKSQTLLITFKGAAAI